MALKESLDKVKETKEKIRTDIEETRKSVQEMRPKPFRRAIDRRMTDIRPLKRIRKRVATLGEESPGE